MQQIALDFVNDGHWHYQTVGGRYMLMCDSWLYTKHKSRYRALIQLKLDIMGEVYVQIQ